MPACCVFQERGLHGGGDADWPTPVQHVRTHGCHVPDRLQPPPQIHTAGTAQPSDHRELSQAHLQEVAHRAAVSRGLDTGRVCARLHVAVR